MSRKRKITSEVDGTPVETDEEDYSPVVDVPSKPVRPVLRVVIWTTKGEEAGAWSEHGQHKAGDKVETDHADILVERGFAEEAE